MVKMTIINPGMELYRYDVVEPPRDWDNTYKSPIYLYKEVSRSLMYSSYEEESKNEIGAFFFFDSMDEAISIGNISLDKRREIIAKENPDLNLWITRTCNEEILNMLDLSCCQDVVDLYVSLLKEKIDIFSNDFLIRRNLLRTISLAEIKEKIFDLASYQGPLDSTQYLEHKNEIEMIFCQYEGKDKLSYACQGLTDFSNGFIFKDILEAKGLDGYIFVESDAKTICLFNSDKLSSPEAQIIKRHD